MSQIDTLQHPVKGGSVRSKGPGGSNKHEGQNGVPPADGDQMVRFFLTLEGRFILEQGADGRVTAQVHTCLLQDVQLGI